MPNDCTLMRPRIQALSTRAYENIVGVVMANPNGEQAGCSCAYSPICWEEDSRCVDNTLFLAKPEEEGLFFADFDLDALRAYRETEMMGNTCRKVHAYADLLNPEIRPPFLRAGQRNRKQTAERRLQKLTDRVFYYPHQPERKSSRSRRIFNLTGP